MFMVKVMIHISVIGQLKKIGFKCTLKSIGILNVPHVTREGIPQFWGSLFEGSLAISLCSCPGCGKKMTVCRPQGSCWSILADEILDVHWCLIMQGFENMHQHFVGDAAFNRQPMELP